MDVWLLRGAQEKSTQTENVVLGIFSTPEKVKAFCLAAFDYRGPWNESESAISTGAKKTAIPRSPEPPPPPIGWGGMFATRYVIDNPHWYTAQEWRKAHDIIVQANPERAEGIEQLWATWDEYQLSLKEQS